MSEIWGINDVLLSGPQKISLSLCFRTWNSFDWSLVRMLYPCPPDSLVSEAMTAKSSPATATTDPWFSW